MGGGGGGGFLGEMKGILGGRVTFSCRSSASVSMARVGYVALYCCASASNLGGGTGADPADPPSP